MYLSNIMANQYVSRRASDQNSWWLAPVNAWHNWMPCYRAYNSVVWAVLAGPFGGHFGNLGLCSPQPPLLYQYLLCVLRTSQYTRPCNCQATGYLVLSKLRTSANCSRRMFSVRRNLPELVLFSLHLCLNPLPCTDTLALQSQSSAVTGLLAKSPFPGHPLSGQ